ncbi:hypothetical protein [Streptomyces sp. NPDC059176]|uniref:hypothetical protein n=1 Tax=unclassified Streptomyces TaxID=2593676 RepID=UPI0036821BAB
MTAADTDRSDRAMDPVRAELLRAAGQDAAALLADAGADAARTVESARRTAAGILEAARRQGGETGAADAAVLLTRARHRVKTRQLAAQRTVYQELRERVGAGVLSALEVRPELRDRLVHRAVALLGPDAVITDCAGGGVLAEAPGRRVDLSLATLADRALERNGAEVELLWAP